MPQQFTELDQRAANMVCGLTLDPVQQANSGHPGLPLGMADAAIVLWPRIMRYHPRDPRWPDRDRFVLSGGHGSMLLYAMLHLSGYKHMTLAQLENFRQYGSLTPGHPEVHLDAGIETTTGPLGQGFATVLAASIRTLLHVVQVAMAGADIGTMPPKVLEQMIQHPLTDKGLASFLKDWETVPDAATVFAEGASDSVPTENVLVGAE